MDTQLQKLGLEEREVAVYMTLLTHGPCSVRKLAGISGINRGSTYDTLKSLRERGLVCHYHEDTKQCFVAEDPGKLKHLLNDRQSELELLSSALEGMIPELQSLFDNGGGKPVVRYYEGPQGIKAILNDVLEVMSSAKAAENKEYYVYSSASVREAGLYNAFPDFTAQRVERGIRVRTIALGHGGTSAELAEHKWIKATEGTPTYILIYGGKCAFVSLGLGATLFGVVIDNPGLYQTQKLLFESQWSCLPKM